MQHSSAHEAQEALICHQLAVVGCGISWSQGSHNERHSQIQNRELIQSKTNSLGGLGKHLMSQLNIYVFVSIHAALL